MYRSLIASSSACGSGFSEFLSVVHLRPKWSHQMEYLEQHRSLSICSRIATVALCISTGVSFFASAAFAAGVFSGFAESAVGAYDMANEAMMPTVNVCFIFSPSIAFRLFSL